MARPAGEWLRWGRPRAGAGRGPRRGYKGSGAAPSPPTPVLAWPTASSPPPPRLAAAARVDAPSSTSRTNPGGPLARGRAHGRSRPAARGLSGPSKRSAAIGAGDSRAGHPAPSAGHDPRRDHGAAPQQASRQVSAPRSRGPEAGVWGWVGAGATGPLEVPTGLRGTGGNGARGA